MQRIVFRPDYLQTPPKVGIILIFGTFKYIKFFGTILGQIYMKNPSEMLSKGFYRDSYRMGLIMGHVQNPVFELMRKRAPFETNSGWTVPDSST